MLRHAQFSLILTLIRTSLKISKSMRSMHIPGKAQLAYLKPFQIAARLEMCSSSLDKRGRTTQALLASSAAWEAQLSLAIVGVIEHSLSTMRSHEPKAFPPPGAQASRSTRAVCRASNSKPSQRQLLFPASTRQACLPQCPEDSKVEPGLFQHAAGWPCSGSCVSPVLFVF